jgi:hypothetical protein
VAVAVAEAAANKEEAADPLVAVAAAAQADHSVVRRVVAADLVDLSAVDSVTVQAARSAAHREAAAPAVHLAAHHEAVPAARSAALRAAAANLGHLAVVHPVVRPRA